MIERYISLQFLRACAAWMVVFLHYSQLYRGFEATTFLERIFTFYGEIGVDIFFVLSGFIMAFSLTSRPKTAASFAWDRFVRIAPAYWIATAVFLIVIQLPLWDHAEFLTHWGWRELVYSLFFIPHQHQADIGIIPVLTVGWTLNYEMFFYGLLAVSLLIHTGKALVIAFGVVMVLPVLSTMGVPTGPIAGSYLLYEFAFGLLIFQLVVKAGQIHKRPLALQIGLGVACLVIALIVLKFKFQFHQSDMVIAVALVLACVCGETVFRMCPKPISALFVHLGNLSYSTYLLHVPALLIVGTLVDRSRDNGLVLIVLSVAATYALSWVSYRVIEQRLSRVLKRPFASKVAKTPVADR